MSREHTRLTYIQWKSDLFGPPVTLLNSAPIASHVFFYCVKIVLSANLFSTTSTCVSIIPRKRFLSLRMKMSVLGRLDILLCFRKSDLLEMINFKKKTVIVKQSWTCIKCVSSLVRSNIIGQMCWPQIFFGVFLLKCTCQFINYWAVNTKDGSVSEMRLSRERIATQYLKITRYLTTRKFLKSAQFGYLA